MKISYWLLRTATLSFLLTCFSLALTAQAISFELNTNKKAFKPGLNDIEIEYTVRNLSNQNMVKVDFGSEIISWRDQNLEADFAQDISNVDPNGNGILEPGETWTKIINHNLFGGLVESFALSGAAVVTSENGSIYQASDATMLFVYGANMDVSFGQECYTLGEDTKVDVMLTTRLLIDEDAAKMPGTTTIIVGGIPIEIDLPASQWEARDLMIAADFLNGGVEFDPFDPPAGVELDLFCEQAGVDAGRNPNNILDECEPIETVRFPCVMMGEDDILCEFPDWVFCYCAPMPANVDEIEDWGTGGGTASITASDNFTIWYAEESPPGSGMYTDFADISANVETGGEDNEGTIFKIIPVELTSFEVNKKGSMAALAWTTASEINNSHFEVMRSSDGSEFEYLGEVAGSGTTNSEVTYSFMDERPLNGTNYYRLTQYDFNGAREFSDVQQIDFNYTGKGSIRVMPNPVSTNLTLAADEFLGVMKMILLDKTGKVIFDQFVDQNEAIDMVDVPSGVYLMKLYDSMGVEMQTEQIIVAK